MGIGKEREKKTLNTGLLTALFAAVCAALMALGDPTYMEYVLSPLQRSLIRVCAVAVCCLGALMLLLAVRKKLSDRAFFAIVITVGFLMRFAWTLWNIYKYNQHDVQNFEKDDGHAGYIFWFVEHGLTLPVYDPVTVYQFYHPPLSHMTLALFMKLLLASGRSVNEAAESLQMVPLFLSLLMMTTGLAIFQELGFTGKALRISGAFWILHPSFFYLSGFLNNDPLSLAYTLLGLLYAIRWYRSGKFSHLMATAVFIGLGMMSKLSAALIAFPVGFLFLLALWKRRKDKPLRLIGQFAAFGAVCAPLGLWWGVRNLIVWNTPITYVPPANNPDIYIGDVPVLERLFGFQFSFPFLSMPYFNNYQAWFGEPLEYSLPSSLIKTSLFGEWTYGTTLAAGEPVNLFSPMTLITLVSYALFWVACLLAVWTALQTVLAFFRSAAKKKTGTAVRAALLILLAVFAGFEIYFSLGSPYVCTNNFRYIFPVLVPLSASLGFQAGDAQSKAAKAASRLSCIAVTGFCLLSVADYLLIYLA